MFWASIRVSAKANGWLRRSSLAGVTRGRGCRHSRVVSRSASIRCGCGVKSLREKKKTMKKLIIAAALVLAFAVQASAQATTPLVELSGGYSFVRNSKFDLNFQGGSGSAAYNFNRWLGGVADIGGYELTNQTGGSGNIVSFLFGPRLSYRGETFTPFAQLLLGGAHASAGFGGGGGGASENSFALVGGGGLDIKLSQHFALRAGPFEYFMTRFGSQTQNNMRLSAGIVIRLGSR
jgi:opacity protein-like surface antigen